MTAYIWISSDLQLGRPEVARSVLANAVDDVLSLGLPLVGAWCLGDALVGADLAALDEVAALSVELYERLGVPVCYVMGNHEMDLRRSRGVNRFPMYERVRSRPGWHTLPSLSALYFSVEVAGHRVFFLGDHADEAGRWFTVAGSVKGEAPEAYPHGPDAYRRLRQAIAASVQPVLIASHYAFRGGQRAGALQDALLPLPANVRAHFHGHAHIGDLVWNRENPWSRVNPIEGSPIRQFNVSALETERTEGSHSAFLAVHGDGRLAIRFRCHVQRAWIGEYTIERG